LNDKIEKKNIFLKIQSKKIAIKTIITKFDKEKKLKDGEIIKKKLILKIISNKINKNTKSKRWKKIKEDEREKIIKFYKLF